MYLFAVLFDDYLYYIISIIYEPACLFVGVFYIYITKSKIMDGIWEAERKTAHINSQIVRCVIRWASLNWEI